MAFNIHKEVPALNRHWSSFIYLMQSFFPQNAMWENLRQKNTHAITRKLKKRLQKKGLQHLSLIHI